MRLLILSLIILNFTTLMVYATPPIGSTIVPTYSGTTVSGHAHVTAGNIATLEAEKADKEARSFNPSNAAEATALGVSIGASVATAIALFLIDTQLTNAGEYSSSTTATLSLIKDEIENDINGGYSQSLNGGTTIIPSSITPSSTTTYVNSINTAKSTTTATINSNSSNTGTSSDKSDSSANKGNDASNLSSYSASAVSSNKIATAYKLLNTDIQNKNYANIANNALFKSTVQRAAEKLAQKNGLSADDLMNDILKAFKNGTSKTIDDNVKDENKQDDAIKNLAILNTHEIDGRNRDLFSIIHSRYENRYFAGLFLNIGDKIKTQKTEDKKTIETKTKVEDQAMKLKVIQSFNNSSNSSKRLPASKEPVIYKNKETDEVFKKW